MCLPACAASLASFTGLAATASAAAVCLAFSTGCIQFCSGIYTAGPCGVGILFAKRFRACGELCHVC